MDEWRFPDLLDDSEQIMGDVIKHFGKIAKSDRYRDIYDFMIPFLFHPYQTMPSNVFSACWDFHWQYIWHKKRRERIQIFFMLKK
jgi:hypothetical protein